MRLGETIVRCEPFAHAVHENHRESVCDSCLMSSGSSSLQLCAACKNVLYCGRECQRAAWKEAHREECRFFREGGRFHLVTARLIARIVVKLRAGKDK
jgi:hypothetical protein